MEIHIVTRGQTLYAIGREYGIAPGLIARYNGLREPYRLAVGQALLILRPLLTYTVRPGDTLPAIAREFSTTMLELYRSNPNLSGSSRLYPGQVLVIRLEQAEGRPISVLGYAYPFVTMATLRGILPYATLLAPFTYGFTADGALLPLADEALRAATGEYGVGTLLHLSTLTEGGGFSSQRAAAVFGDRAARSRLIDEAVAAMEAGGYRGVDVDFEFLGGALAGDYAEFLRLLGDRVRAAGGILLTALAPKTSADQRGTLYEGHDYGPIGAASDGVLLMTYEWGYTAGPPMAVAPIDPVRRVVEYALTEIPAEKILLGFPNYGYDWTLPYRSGQTRARSLGNEEAVQLAVDAGAEIQYDEAAQTPFFLYTDGEGLAHQVWFEDVRSSLAKFRLLEEYALAGLGYWNFMRPFAANFSLLNHLYRLDRRENPFI